MKQLSLRSLSLSLYSHFFALVVVVILQTDDGAKNRLDIANALALPPSLHSIRMEHNEKTKIFVFVVDVQPIFGIIMAKGKKQRRFFFRQAQISHD